MDRGHIRSGRIIGQSRFSRPREIHQPLPTLRLLDEKSLPGDQIGHQMSEILQIRVKRRDQGMRFLFMHQPLKALQALVDVGAAGRIVCESPVLEEDTFVIREKWLEISGEQAK